MRRPTVKIIQQQEESVNSDRQLTEEETKAYLYKNHPDIYKQMYPDTVVEKPSLPHSHRNPHQKRVNQDIQKSNKIYKYDKYDSASQDDGGFSYKIQITTDMKL